MVSPPQPKKVAPRKQLEKLFKKLEILGVSDIKSFLEELYHRYMSLEKISKVLRRKGVSLRPKDLTILFEYLGIRRVKHGPRKLLRTSAIVFKGNKKEKLYLWGFCFGDARIYSSLSTIRIDVTGKLSTVQCLYQALKKFSSKPLVIKATQRGYYSISVSVDKETFDFLLSEIDDIFQEIQSLDDLSALLAGLIDSEGSIMYRVRKREYVWKNQKRISYTFDNHIEITNSNYHLLEKIKEMLHRYGIQSSIPRSKTGFGCWRLRINKRSHIAKIAPLLLRYMKHGEKKQRLEILYNIIQKICNMKQKQKREFLKKLEKK